MSAQEFKAIGEESRMRILELLLERNYCVGALAQILQISESAVSQHIKVLREAGLLQGERSGYFMHYHVRREKLREMGDELHSMSEIKRQACEQEKTGYRRNRRLKRQHCRKGNGNGTTIRHRHADETSDMKEE